MLYPVLLSTGATVGIIVGVAVVVIVVAVILYLTLFSSMRYKKQVRDLSRRFEYLHALLYGQDSQYIKRIEIISLTNLLYVDTHMAFNKRFKDIRDKSDAAAQTAINNLKDLLTERDYKTLKSVIPTVKQTLESYDKEVNALNDALLTIIKPEEECRQQSLALKEELRKIKQDYYVKQADLSLVSNSFETVFKKMEEQFKNFETFVESAQYEDAKAMLPKIEGLIKELGADIKVLPNLCIAIQSVIPEKIVSLENRYDEMIHDEYPLHHFISRDDIEGLRKQLEAIATRLQSFQLNGAQQELDGILARIEEYMESFQKEKEARHVFETECDGIYAEDTAIEKKYIRLCNSLPDVKKIYVIPPEVQSNIDGIKNLINKSGATKRSLDTYIHSGTRQPYTILVEKMETLQGESNQASEAIDAFNRYLYSLKEDSEEAVEAVKTYYGKVKSAEYLLPQIELPAVEEKYAEKISSLYEKMDGVYKALRTLPIDVEEVNKVIALIREEGEHLYHDVKTDYEQMLLCDASILYANRERRNLAEVNHFLLISEELYFKGDFKRSYEETTALVKRLRGEE